MGLKTYWVKNVIVIGGEDPTTKFRHEKLGYEQMNKADEVEAWLQQAEMVAQAALDFSSGWTYVGKQGREAAELVHDCKSLLDKLRGRG